MNPSEIPLPPHAYVPGKTARHPEDWFDPIKSTLHPNVSVTDTQCWRAGLVYLHAGYNWECHELLETVWLSLPNPSAERDMVLAIIQLANARLKIKMDRPKATLRLCEIVEKLLSDHSGTILNLKVCDVLHWVTKTRELAE